MKRCLLSLLIGCLIALSAQAQTSPPPEPRGIYGYISLVDPITGQLHLGISPADHRAVDSVTVFFRSPIGAGTRTVFIKEIDPSTGLMDVANTNVAWQYCVILRQIRSVDASFTGDPFLIRGPSGSCYEVNYNPDLWRFDRIEARYYVETRQGLDVLRVPLSARKTPFSQFPNRP